MTSKCCVVLTDLGNFSGRTRNAVSVREGQGVVLMCSPPPHSPGTVPVFHVTTSLVCYFFILLDCATGDHGGWHALGGHDVYRRAWVITDHTPYIALFFCDTIVFFPLCQLLSLCLWHHWWAIYGPECKSHEKCKGDWCDYRVPCFTMELRGWWHMVLFATIEPNC